MSKRGYELRSLEHRRGEQGKDDSTAGVIRSQPRGKTVDATEPTDQVALSSSTAELRSRERRVSEESSGPDTEEEYEVIDAIDAKTGTEDPNPPTSESENNIEAAGGVEDVKQLKTDLQRAQKQIDEKNEQIVRLCKQVSQAQPNVDDDFHLLSSTPFSSLPAEPPAASSAPTTHAAEHECREVMFASSAVQEYVGQLREQSEDLNIQWKEEERRAKYFEKEYHRLEVECATLRLAAGGGGSTVADLREKLAITESRLEAIERHSKSQSQRTHTLQNEAKERDAEALNLRTTVKDLEGYIQVLKATMERKELDHQQTDKSLKSFSHQVRKLTNENSKLQERMVKFGALQTDSRELNTRVAQLEFALKKAVEEKQELESLLDFTQAQAKVYEEDFKTEREDRTRAFAEREKEGERYKEEIERLQTQLKSHKGNLTDLEIFHQARQRELLQAMDDLKKSQEEVQAKTSQVKQYKKQHDGLVSKVSTLEREKKELASQFEVMRQQIEEMSTKRKSTRSTHGEGELSRHTQADFEKQAKSLEKYKSKSYTRKAQLTKMTASYSAGKNEVLQLRKEVGKQRREKKVAPAGGDVSVSSPAGSSELQELQELCRNLRDENEELKTHVKVLMEVNQHLNGSLAALADDMEDHPAGSPTSQDSLTSPEEEIPNPATGSTTRTLADVKPPSSNRPRANTYGSPQTARSKPPTKGHNPDHGVPHYQEHHVPHYQNVPEHHVPHYQNVPEHHVPHYQNLPEHHVPHYQNLPGTNTASGGAAKTNTQHADHVNNSRIKDNSQKSPAPPLPLPDAGALPAPIASFGGAAAAPGRPNIPPDTRGTGANRGVFGLERRGSAPSRAPGGVHHAQALNEMQHQFQHDQHGPASLPTQPTATHQPPTGLPPVPPPTAVPTEVQHQGSDILTPGINTEVHDMAQDLLEGMGEGGEHGVTGTPYDPNLTCIICQKMFRVGEIQMYRAHTATCDGSMI